MCSSEYRRRITAAHSSAPTRLNAATRIPNRVMAIPLLDTIPPVVTPIGSTWINRPPPIAVLNGTGRTSRSITHEPHSTQSNFLSAATLRLPPLDPRSPERPGRHDPHDRAVPIGGFPWPDRPRALDHTRSGAPFLSATYNRYLSYNWACRGEHPSRRHELPRVSDTACRTDQPTTNELPPTAKTMEKSLDRKIARILADSSCRDFIVADAKDADMAFGLSAPGMSPEHHAGEARFRTLEEYRQLIRDVVRQGLVDIALMSASSNEILTIQERMFDNSPVTPAIRANDTTDIWLAAGTGQYGSQPSVPFRSATIDHAMCGKSDCQPHERRLGRRPGTLFDHAQQRCRAGSSLA